MTKPNRINAIAHRAEHERPTRPAPAFTACRAAALREACNGRPAPLPRDHRSPDGLRATLSIDPVTQAELLALSAALTAPRVPQFVGTSFPQLARDAIELEVDSLFADLGAE